MKKESSAAQKRLTTFFPGGDTSYPEVDKTAIKSFRIGSKKSSTKPIRIGGSRFGSCPLCGQSIALYKLEFHAAECQGLVVQAIDNFSPAPHVIRENRGPINVSSSISHRCKSNEKGDPPLSSASVSLDQPLTYTEPIPGLFLFENFTTLKEETEMLRMLDFEDVVPWTASSSNGKYLVGKRWGVHCNLRDRRVDAPQHPLPRILQDFIQHKLSKVKQLLANKNVNLRDFVPNEANAIDYRRRKGHVLAAHVDDRQLSKEPIANLSLAGNCIMTFQNQKHTPASTRHLPEKHRVLLKHGTLQLLTGKARYNYSHAIANEDLLSDRRVSITMRESPLTPSIPQPTRL